MPPGHHRQPARPPGHHRPPAGPPGHHRQPAGPAARRGLGPKPANAGAPQRPPAPGLARHPGLLGPIVALGLLAVAGNAVAEPLPPPDRRAAVTLLSENDAYGLDGSDRWYTNGLRLGWLSPEGALPAPLAWLDARLAMLFGPANARWGVSLTQRIFTPVNKRTRDPDPRDRPYAGTLMAGLALDRRTGSTLDRFALQVGVVGPASLAQASQSTVHHALNIATPLGWGSQLRNEPLFNLSWERTWRLPLTAAPAGALGVDILPATAISLGTEQVYAGAGARLRIGQGLEQDFGPPRIRPASETAAAPVGEEFGWYLFVGAGGRAVGHDITLNGNLWRDSPSVAPRHFVGEIEAGAAVFWRGTRLSFVHVWRSKEFIAQSRPFEFGAIALTVAF